MGDTMCRKAENKKNHTYNSVFRKRGQCNPMVPPTTGRALSGIATRSMAAANLYKRRE